MHRLALVAIILAEVVYLVVGGLIFWALESEREQTHKTAQRNFNLSGLLNNLTVEFPCLSLKNLSAITYQILEFERSGLLQSRESNDWDIHGSIFFAMTVVTTIGYGNVAPKTIGGQLFCCFFAIVGIPFTMVMLVGIGDVLREVSARINWRLGETRPRLHKLLHAVAMTTVGIVLFLLLPAAIFTAIEDWSYGTAVYYGVVTATTVGFGDFVAAWTCVGAHCWMYRISVGTWMFLALAWLAGVIGTIQDGFQMLISKSDSATEKVFDEVMKRKQDDKEDKEGEGRESGDAAGSDVITSLVPLKTINKKEEEVVA